MNAAKVECCALWVPACADVLAARSDLVALAVQVSGVDDLQKAVEELSAQHEKALLDSQEQHMSVVQTLQSEAEQLKQGHTEQLESARSEHAAAGAAGGGVAGGCDGGGGD